MGAGALMEATFEGARHIKVQNQECFSIGEDLILDAGTEFQEVGEIAAFGSLVLKNPLQFPHSAGASVRATPPIIINATAPARSSLSQRSSLGMPAWLPWLWVLVVVAWIAVCVGCACTGKRGRR